VGLRDPLKSVGVQFLHQETKRKLLCSKSNDAESGYALPTMVALGLQALATTLEEEELVDLKDQFEAIDVEHRGTITLEELKKVREALASLSCRDGTYIKFPVSVAASKCSVLNDYRAQQSVKLYAFFDGLEAKLDRPRDCVSFRWSLEWPNARQMFLDFTSLSSWHSSLFVGKQFSINS
jgi:hypothetical protein